MFRICEGQGLRRLGSFDVKKVGRVSLDQSHNARRWPLKECCWGCGDSDVLRQNRRDSSLQQGPARDLCSKLLCQDRPPSPVQLCDHLFEIGQVKPPSSANVKRGRVVNAVESGERMLIPKGKDELKWRSPLSYLSLTLHR